MPRVGFEPTITTFERAKSVHALDRVVMVFGLMSVLGAINYEVTRFEEVSNNAVGIKFCEKSLFLGSASIAAALPPGTHSTRARLQSGRSRVRAPMRWHFKFT
jgi:hypothetical protein